MSETAPLHFRNGQEWREWLERNHVIQHEVWLLHGKKGIDHRCLNLSEAVDEALCFGWIDSRLVTVDHSHYALRYSPRRPGSVWSRTNRERAEKLIETGKMTKAGLASIEAARKRGTWQAAYTDRERVPVPADLSEALSKDEKAMANFDRFPVSSQNMYVRWVTAAKREATRSKRIAEVFRRSALNKKPGEGRWDED